MQPMDDLLGMNPPKQPQMARPVTVPQMAPTLPTPPGVDEADTKARTTAAEYNERSKRKGKTQTILTSAQGVLGEAPTAAKQLFGN